MAIRFTVRRLLLTTAIFSVAVALIIGALRLSDDLVRESAYHRYMQGYFTREEARRHAGPIVDAWPLSPKDQKAK
jgi:hypothetical protein